MRRYRSDTRFDQAQSIAELEHMARRRLPNFAWEYLAGGAEDEITLQRNRQAFADIGLMPSTLMSCAELDTTRELFGQTRALPLAIGPTGFNGMLHKDADIALARAARDKGVQFSLSTVSSNSLEEVAAAVPDGELWFQLYWLNDAEVQDDLLRRAEAAGVRTLLLTSDAVLIGNREWDRRNFARPLQLTWRNKFDVLRHPGWIRQALWPQGMPKMGNLLPYLPADASNTAGAAHFMAHKMEMGLCWDSLARLRQRWPHRLILKGVQTGADARRCVEMGLDGIVVTNHGGRQLDGAPASLDCLPAIAEAVRGQLTILLDSGIRRGSDIAKACALGADAVLLGRATLFGVAVGGQAGAAHALNLLEQELRRVLGLVGTPRLAELDRSKLVALRSVLAG